jgi:hypothetical protein
MPASVVRADMMVEWIVENYNGRWTLSGKEGEGKEIAFSASLIV